jgi:hypothetical protein
MFRQGLSPVGMVMIDLISFHPNLHFVVLYTSLALTGAPGWHSGVVTALKPRGRFRLPQPVRHDSACSQS